MKINLLMVDDIEPNLYALEVLFEDLEIKNKDFQGLTIFKALSGEEALSIALKEKIDLILLDIRMPGMDGFQVAEFLKMTKKTKEIPIVFLTAEFKSDEFINKGYKIGALDYFIKPIEKFQFLSKMRLYIDLFLSRKIETKKFNDTLSEYMNLMDRHMISSDMDIDGNITRVSHAFCDISAYSKEELMGNSCRMVRSPDVSSELYAEIQERVSKNAVWKGQMKNRTKYGEYYWTESFISPKKDEHDNIIGSTCVEHNITDKKELETISITDGLTGIFNRRYFDEIFSNMVNNARRDNRLFCFSLIDIDFFKRYNDTYGHQMGDEALKKVADVFQSFTNRADDYCFRIGGEEFSIIFSANENKKAFDFITKIKQSVEDLKIPHSKNDASQYLTISVALTCKEGREIESQESLFEQTDQLLYIAKRTGRNKVVSKCPA